MARRNSLKQKAARRERKLAEKQSENNLSKDNLSNELNSFDQNIKKKSNDKVGIVIDLIRKSGQSKPIIFETDKNEFFELIEKLKFEKDIKSQQEGWFQIMVLALMEITPIDHTFFNAAVLTIASTSAFIDSHNQSPNKPIAFSIMIQEGEFGCRILHLTYKVWQEILKHYNLKPKKLIA
jgi:hypothetical protein